MGCRSSTLINGNVYDAGKNEPISDAATTRDCKCGGVRNGKRSMLGCCRRRRNVMNEQLRCSDQPCCSRKMVAGGGGGGGGERQPAANITVVVQDMSGGGNGGGGRSPVRTSSTPLELSSSSCGDLFDAVSGSRLSFQDAWLRITGERTGRGHNGRLSPTKNVQNSGLIDDESFFKIVRCFPFPSPKPTPKNSNSNSPRLSPIQRQDDDGRFANRVSALLKRKFSDNTHDHAPTCSSTLGIMVRTTVETAVPLLVPWQMWLRERLASWTQLSGHQGTIVPATEKTLWKKRAVDDGNETQAYLKLMNDTAGCMVPKFYKEVQKNGEYFIEIEDLTRSFENPCIMDVKMGTRTFLEKEVCNQSKRVDLYNKMVAIDPTEPTEQERQDKAITKLRYMQFRENESSTASLGFRIEAIKMSDGELEKNFQKIKTREQIAEVFRRFFAPGSRAIREKLSDRLKDIRAKILVSEFFRHHEIIGSSLLIVYDAHNVGAWMIDFAKALPIDGLVLDHRSAWTLGNHEDGYLIGLDNLIDIIENNKF